MKSRTVKKSLYNLIKKSTVGSSGFYCSFSVFLIYLYICMSNCYLPMSLPNYVHLSSVRLSFCKCVFIHLQIHKNNEHTACHHSGFMETRVLGHIMYVSICNIKRVIYRLLKLYVYTIDLCAHNVYLYWHNLSKASYIRITDVVSMYLK